ncbi:hypothetical protein LINGRAHAP2_LOCUS20200 [Linum grandiflorum]
MEEQNFNKNPPDSMKEERFWTFRRSLVMSPRGGRFLPNLVVIFVLAGAVAFSDEAAVLSLEGDEGIRWKNWFHSRSRLTPVTECSQIFDKGSIFLWALYLDEVNGDSPECNFQVVAPLIHFLSIIWHLPDRVLHYFRMKQPIPCIEMQQREVMSLLGLTQRREFLIRQMMDQYQAMIVAR